VSDKEGGEGGEEDESESKRGGIRVRRRPYILPVMPVVKWSHLFNLQLMGKVET
jgi:hypothetical protein